MKLSVWERLAGVRCAICGVREREGETLEWHHVDGNRHNTAAWNLVKAHKICHLNLTKLNGQYVDGKKSRIPDGTASGAGAGVRVGVQEGSSSLLVGVDPRPTASMVRGEEIWRGLLRFLWEVALKEQMTDEVILKVAPGWINDKRPPSKNALARWLDVLTNGVYPFRFNELHQLVLVKPEYVPGKGVGESASS